MEIFCPEIVLCATIVLLLLVRLFDKEETLPPCWIALIGALVAFAGLLSQFTFLTAASGSIETIEPLEWLFRKFGLSADGAGASGAYFTGLLMHNAFTLAFRLGLGLFLVLMIALTVLTGIPDNEDGPDFYTLLVGSTIGMMIATSANNLLMLFLGIEMMSVPSYVMVGFLKGRRQSSEAALKYVVYGAGAAGVMLYGISLLAGMLGTGDFSQLGPRLAFLLQGGTAGLSNPTVVTTLLGIMFVLVGVAFKLSLVPFHFWCPDAFEGACAEVAGFLSVASKAASFALLVRFLLAITTGGSDLLQPLSLHLGIALAFIAAVSMTFGNLAAYSQTNVKRLLAYSTIAHAGYMLMAVSALLVFQNGVVDGQWSAAQVEFESARALEGLMYYLAVYLFMNLTAFAVVAMIRNEIHSEEIADYAGFVNHNGTAKVLCACMAIALFSLIGVPPFGGFFAKMMIFLSVFKAGHLHWFMWLLLAVAGVNTVISLFYYLNVLKAMFLKDQPAATRPLQIPGVLGAYVMIVTIPIVLLGASRLQNHLAATAHYVASTLFN